MTLGILAIAAAVGVFILRHLHDDVRRIASRLLACPPGEIEIEALTATEVERYRVQGCGGGGVMTCEPGGSLCSIVPEGP